MTIRVTADISYIDGNLTGLTIPSGYAINVPDTTHAIRTTQWLTKVRDTGDFIRAAITGDRYKIVGNITHYTI